ncbi:DUF1704 domain-containing protein [Candidatus Woesearchaeota archaeon]|nr:DUF1704 domain-containing protein [Candidatus Woesearchaeota archaeon]MCF7901375.1 DUF1704 domain-containing protein [Candidatus Woesearchaeota archaeon]MCF8013154.1 DUF1704 domain-containing protein [Candidatus Woesearchaeota archaeon]
MTEIDVFKDVDKEIFEIGKRLRPLFYSNPVNEETQKDLFLEGKIKEPEFEYLTFDRDESPELIKKMISKVKIPSGFLKDCYKKKLKSLSILNDMLKYRGNKKKRFSFSSELYGVPSDNLVKLAKQIVSEPVNLDGEDFIEIDYFVKELRSALVRLSLSEWSVELIDKKQMMVHQELKKIFVGKKANYTLKDVQRLVIHEIGWHVIRAANGFNQPLKLFVSGFPDYILTEEGGALFLEKKFGLLEDSMLRMYAGRVLAVHFYYKKYGFRKVFELLKGYGFGDESSWELTLRVFRGGGLGKDYLYLKGLLEFERVADLVDDFSIFYTGKIGIGDLELVKVLLDKKIIRQPFILPEFIKDLK